MTKRNISYLEDDSIGNLDVVRELFREYERFLGFDLCFQDFEQELALLPGRYALPDGSLIIAYVDQEPAGCVALRKLEDGICEMKRLYLRSPYRGLGLGRTLASRIVEKAQQLGYSRMRLDTVPKLQEAIALYQKLGFVDIPAYCPNPIEGARFMERELTAPL